MKQCLATGHRKGHAEQEKPEHPQRKLSHDMSLDKYIESIRRSDMGPVPARVWYPSGEFYGVLPLSPGNPTENHTNAALQQALARLRAGELVVIPTETVYGLAADAENPAAVASIFRLKGRPATHPLIVHIPDAEQLHHWARDIPDYAWTLANTFWPGPISLVLRRSSRVPDVVTGGQDSVALRIPQHPLTLRLLQMFGGGIAAPSANRYGRISPTTPAHVEAQFGDDTPFILDGGPCQGGIESTIVSCLETTPRILRPGLITATAVAEITGLSVSEQNNAFTEVRTAGQDKSHYAPTTPTILISRSNPAGWPELSGQRTGFLGFGEPPMAVTMAVKLPSDSAGAAQRLYAALHSLDNAGLDLILLESPPASPQWDGIRDRLTRASAASTSL